MLHGDSTYTARQTKVVIPKELMVAKQAHELFSFIAGHIKTFLETYHKEQLLASQPILNLGFCFSFPAYQTSINSGVLLRWTKGFDIPEAVGTDVCQLLQHELDRLQLPVRVSALVNDAAGTIMTRAYSLPVSKTRTSIGAIFGTGTNGVYLEQISKITKDIGAYDPSTGEMFLSIEWGSFDNELSVLSNTKYDVEVNSASVNRDNQMFEKRVSGMFLGELLRVAVLEMHNDPEVALLPGIDQEGHPSPLYTRWAVDASILSVAESDDSPELNTLRSKIQESFGIPASAISLVDVQAVKKVAHAIGRRAARLAGMAIGAVVLQSGKLQYIDPIVLPAVDIDGSHSNHGNDDGGEEEIVDEARMVDVGVDGSVIELYPQFEQYMREALRVIEGIGVSGERRIRIGIAKDGSSIGAAIIASLAAEQLNQ
jgi:hexokinase